MTPEDKALEADLRSEPDATAEADALLDYIEARVQARLTRRGGVPANEERMLFHASIRLLGAREARRVERPDAALVDAVNAAWLAISAGVRLKLQKGKKEGQKKSAESKAKTTREFEQKWRDEYQRKYDELRSRGYKKTLAYKFIAAHFKKLDPEKEKRHNPNRVMSLVSDRD